MKAAVSIVATLVFATLSFGAPKESTFTGEIMDNECAKVGSHEMMMKKEATLQHCNTMGAGLL